jgi:hypothetical protein
MVGFKNPFARFCDANWHHIIKISIKRAQNAACRYARNRVFATATAEDNGYPDFLTHLSNATETF